MRLYYTGASPDNLRQAREHAPSHVHGAGWTPAKMTPHPVPWFLDNGAYADDFDPDAFEQAMQDAKEMPSLPDFIVLPDVYGDAEATRDRHHRWLTARKPDHPWRSKYAVLSRGDFTRYAVLQPGRSIDEQIGEWASKIYVDGLFLGGPVRWKRAVGNDVVEQARANDLPVHVGNPGGADGLVWAYRTGFDSADTTTVFQNGYWHYLDRLERATEETTPSPAHDSSQSALDGWVET